MSTSNDVFDLAEGHTPEQPKVNRIRVPDRQHPAYSAMMRSSTVLDIVADLIGPNIRFDHSKLNCKPAGGGATIGMAPKTGHSTPRPTTICFPLT